MKHSNNTFTLGKNIITNCTDCKKCVKDCLFLDDNTDSIADFIKRFLEDMDFDPNVAYSCSLCGRCTKICPKNLEMKCFFQSVREDICAKNKSKSPLKSHSAIHMHQKLGFSKLFSVLKKGGDKQ